ncbi:MAG: MarR family transcriptional regulator [Pseudomonadota bacterium]
MTQSEATEETEDIIELLFFAYRDFTADADAILADMGLGRAHHRALHFINRKPGLSVAELLDLLGITKQGLARVLRDLVNAGFVIQTPSKHDGRRRLLQLSPHGTDLINRLRAPQSRRIKAALAGRDTDATVVRAFLNRMLNEASVVQRGQMMGVGRIEEQT